MLSLFSVRLCVTCVAVPAAPSELQSQFIVGWKEVPNHENYLTEVQQALVSWRFLLSPRGLEEEVELLSLHSLAGIQKNILKHQVRAIFKTWVGAKK